MKSYQAKRSLYGDLGSLRRNEVLKPDDPRLVGKQRTIDDLVKRKLLVEFDDKLAVSPKAKRRGKTEEQEILP